MLGAPASSPLGGAELSIDNTNTKHAGLSLLDVLRQLDVHAQGTIVGDVNKPSELHGARLACKALRDVVDHTVERVSLTMTADTVANWRPGQASPLARMRRCRQLRIYASDEMDYDEAPHLPRPPLLASLALSGVDATVAGGITTLSVAGDWDFQALVEAALMAGGRLPNVEDLDLYPIRGFESTTSHALPAYTAIRAAMPKLKSLLLPYNGWLEGLEAFRGSEVTCVSATCNEHACGQLRLAEANSLVQLPQLRYLLLRLGREGAASLPHESDWDGDAEHLPRDEDDAATLAGLDEAAEEQLHALRLLFISAPAEMEWMRIEHLCVSVHGSFCGRVLIDFEGGELSLVGVSAARGTECLNYLAAALLSRLAATGQQRIRKLVVESLSDSSSSLTNFLQPQRPLARLLGVCECVALVKLALADESPYVPAVVLPALERVVQLFGLPEQLQLQNGLIPQGSVFLFGLQCRAEAAGDGSGKAGDDGGVDFMSGGNEASRRMLGQLRNPAVQSLVGPDLPALATATAALVLQQTLDKVWEASRMQARLRQIAEQLQGDVPIDDLNGPPSHLILRGPFIRQLATGHEGIQLLKAWLDARALQTPAASAEAVEGLAGPGQPAGGAAAVAGGAGEGGAAAAQEVPAVPQAAAAAADEPLERPVGACCLVAFAPAADAALVVCRFGAATLRLQAALESVGAVVPGSLVVRHLHLAAHGDDLENLNAWHHFMHAMLQTLWDRRRIGATGAGIAAGVMNAADEVQAAAAAQSGGIAEPAGAAAARSDAAAGTGAAPHEPQAEASAQQAAAGSARHIGVAAGGAVGGKAAGDMGDLEALQRLVVLADQARREVLVWIAASH
ncbi:hypothetical protein HYH02_009735 [Chlamydomonas schloesseri]|uniref:Uncharacterized protein n=1 Tax=Chlamydomonas schloesseri TaxID=2026947 RepID=A0A835TNK3_9CHLO|nr:hypothetical protein HYH02_009735 [Chlamydomonas schloesseri]|eukprot:KAG2442251.1 hypothetical protein HYH02_009735 [Chlamydomonas schloesseri]